MLFENKVIFCAFSKINKGSLQLGYDRVHNSIFRITLSYACPGWGPIPQPLDCETLSCPSVPQTFTITNSKLLYYSAMSSISRKSGKRSPASRKSTFYPAGKRRQNFTTVSCNNRTIFVIAQLFDPIFDNQVQVNQPKVHSCTIKLDYNLRL